jgi:hypothetical protein
MWTCTQFVDWLATLDLDALSPQACLTQEGKSSSAVGDQTANADNGNSYHQMDGSDCSRGSDNSAWLGGCADDQLLGHKKGQGSASQSDVGPCTSSGSCDHEPTDTRQGAKEDQGQRRQAELVWARIQRRMKQEVLYTLVSAAGTIDRRARSFELFGYASPLCSTAVDSLLPIRACLCCFSPQPWRAETSKVVLVFYRQQNSAYW